jgi:hypothetical protein
VPVGVALVLALIAIACGGPFERWLRRFQSPAKPSDPDDA